jgi:hypothetical protein
MLTPDMSIVQWWIFAIVSGVALGVAAMSLATTRARKLGSFLVPFAGALSIAGNSLARGYSGKEPLFLFTLCALTLVVLRLIYARWINRQMALHRAGEPADEVTRKQIAFFLLVWVAVTVLVAFLIG